MKLLITLSKVTNGKNTKHKHLKHHTEQESGGIICIENVLYSARYRGLSTLKFKELDSAILDYKSSSVTLKTLSWDDLT